MKTRLKEVRESHNVKQSELASALQVKQNTISMWESGQREPDYETLIKIAAYFGVTTDYLLGRDAFAPQIQQAPPLARDESRILAVFRNLSAESKRALIAVANQMQPVAQI